MILHMCAAMQYNGTVVWRVSVSKNVHYDFTKESNKEGLTIKNSHDLHYRGLHFNGEMIFNF